MASLRSSFLSRLVGTPSTDVRVQVAENLARVFNTRKGCGCVVPEFGLGDYEEAGTTHAAMLVLVDELRALAALYEPRLCDPVVEVMGRYGYRMVRFSLNGLVDGEPAGFYVDIDTRTRRVDVGSEVG